MKKIIFYLAFAFFTTSTVMAQEFELGTNVINAGIGLGGYYSASGSASPVFNVSYERGLWEVGPGVISLGAYLGRKSYSYDYEILGTNYDYSWTYNIIGVRGAYHYTGFEIDNLDVYGGTMLSLNIKSGDDYGDDTYPSISPFVGGRWYFSDSFAGFAEAGYGVAYLTLGASFRF